MPAQLNRTFTIARQNQLTGATSNWTLSLDSPKPFSGRFCLSLVAAASALCPAATGLAHAQTMELRGRLEPALLTSNSTSPSRPILLGVSISGASAFSNEKLAEAYTDKLAKPVDLQDVVEIAERITSLYRSEGLFLSQAVAGPQDLSSGIANITVFEGQITSVRVEGERADLVRPLVSDLNNASLVRLADIDARLTRVREIPGLKVTSQVRPNPDDPREHELVLQTEFDEDRIFAGLNNWGWERTGPLQAYTNYVRNSLFLDGDQASLSLFTTPENPSEFTQLAGGYTYAFTRGDRLRTGLSLSLSEAGYDPDDQGQGGESIGYWTRYERPLKLRRSQSVWFIAGFDIQHQENDWITGGGYRDELRVVRLGLRGVKTDDAISTRYSVKVSSGLDIFGASGKSAMNRSRFDADAEFLKIDASLSHYRDIGRYFGVYADISGQFSNEPLLVSEEFSVGGPDLGRAYRYGELTGDRGLGGQIEFRAGFDPESEVISFLQGYTFYDIAAVWNAAPAGWEQEDLSSAGLGMRVSLLDSVSARLEMAKPLTRTPYDETDNDWRQFFQLSVAY